MSSKSGKSKGKKPLETSLGQAPKETVDLSHVQKPINTSIFGLKQVLSLFQTATNEVQNYIQFECDVLYECRVCRTIFRSLANFILHKRNYCRDKFQQGGASAESGGGFVFENNDKETAAALDTENKVAVEEILGGKSTNCRKKTITPIIDKLLKQQEIQKIAKQALNEDLTPKNEEKQDDDVVFVSEEKGLMLEKLESNPGVVFQTLIQPQSLKNNDELMKSEVMEIHGIFDKNEVVLDSAGKVCNFRPPALSLTTITSSPHSKPQTQEFRCTECETKFATQKTLTHHIKYKHNKTCIVYPCPDCKETYANAWGVYRHLYKVHRRTQAQVRRMRAQIHASGIPKSAEPAKKEPRMLLDLKDGAADADNQWMSNFESDKDFQMCGGCGKRFERKAALHSHSQMCTKRQQAVFNAFKGARNVAKASTSSSSIKAAPLEQKIVLKGAAKRKPLLFTSQLLKPVASEEDGKRKKVAAACAPIAKKQVVKDAEAPSVTLSSHEDVNAEAEKFEENKIFIANAGSPSSEELLVTAQHEEEFSEKDPLNLSDLIKENNDGDLVITKCSFNASDEAEKETRLEHHQHEVEVFTISDDSTHSLESPNSSTTSASKKSEMCTIEPVITTVIISSRKRKRSVSSASEEEEIVIPEEFKECLRDDSDYFFYEKAFPFFDTFSLCCIPCQKSYCSPYQLLWHMSLHFSWYRFQCSKCAFMSFNRFDCTGHAAQHHSTPNALMESTVLPIPKWKVESITHSFRELTEEEVDRMEALIKSSKGGSLDAVAAMPVLEPAVVSLVETKATATNELIVLEEDDEIAGSRKKVEVEVGSEAESCNKTPSPVLMMMSNRPVRNRTKSVKTVQDDFIYDLAKALKLNDTSIKNGKVKRSAASTAGSNKVVKD